MIKYYFRTINNRLGSITISVSHVSSQFFIIIHVCQFFECFTADLIIFRCARGNDKKQKFRTINANVQRSYNHWHG